MKLFDVLSVELGTYRSRRLASSVIVVFFLNSNLHASSAFELSGFLDGLLVGGGFDASETGDAPGVVKSGDSAVPQEVSVATSAVNQGKKAYPPVAESVEFDERFVNSSIKVDLSKYSKKGYVEPGYYNVEVRVNGNIMFYDRILFRVVQDEPLAVPCLTVEQILKAGVSSTFAKDDNQCYNVQLIAPGAKFSYEISEGILDLNVPQAYVIQGRKGIADKALWDAGVPSLFSQYSLTSSRTISKEGGASGSNFLRLDNGASVYGWQWRNSLTLNSLSQQGQLNTLNNYIRTDVDYIMGEFKAGNFYTPGTLLDAVNVKGLGINSVDDMVPDDEQNYVPTIRGVAETNAVVTVLQNGQEVYKAQVSPGPFALNDVQAGGFSGSLLVRITEADGRVRSFQTPYNAVPQLVRKGRFRYQLSSGVYTSPNTPGYSPFLTQGYVQYGVLSNLTGYLGSTLSSDYKSYISGVAVNTFLGGLGVDITSSSTSLVTGAVAGDRLRVNYSKVLGATGTNINVVVSKTNGPNFYNVSDAMNVLGSAQPGTIPINGVLPVSFVNTSNAKTLSSVNLAQNLGDYGTLTLASVAQTFWPGGSSISYSAAYRQNFKSFSLSLGANKQIAFYPQQMPTSFSLSLSIPFGGGTINTNSSTNASGINNQASYSGNLGDRQQYTYNVGGNVGGGYGNGNIGAGVNANFGTYNINYNVGSGYENAIFSANGGLLVHSGGVTLGRRVNDTVTIVEAKNAVGARINGDYGSAIDWNGYAIVDSLRPYRKNSLYISPKTLPNNVELTSTSQETTPRQGAVTKAVFSTKGGRGVIFSIKGDGYAIPFGSSLRNELGDELALLGQGGQAFLRGIPPKGVLSVVWGAKASNMCSFEYVLPAHNPASIYDKLFVVCK